MHNIMRRLLQNIGEKCSFVIHQPDNTESNLTPSVLAPTGALGDRISMS